MLNYTFDLSLDDHLEGRISNPDFLRPSKALEFDFENLDDTQDQVDNLL